MEPVESKVVFEGKLVTLRIDSFEAEGDSTSEREIVAHPGAVAIVAHDEERFFMVRQRREAVGVDDLLELPAGKLDVDEETPLQAAQRELEEEVGLQASDWRPVKRFYSSPGFTDEEVHVFFATGLRETEPDPDEGEELEIVPVPLDELEATISRCSDAKSLIGLLLLRDALNR